MPEKLKLLVVIASVRPGRAGLPVGTWFYEFAKAQGSFDVELADLKEINLPFMDEAKHPRLRQYEHQHTKDWSKMVDAADAFVFVTPEYNFSAPPSLLNAIDFLVEEWNRKPAGLVSYGGVSGGTRSSQMLKQTISAVGMMPLPLQVVIPFIAKKIGEDGAFMASEVDEKAALTVLTELVDWAGALRSLRNR